MSNDRRETRDETVLRSKRIKLGLVKNSPLTYV